MSRHLSNHYFDTPGRELFARGLALRLRRSGEQWLQTLKGPAGGAGGLHARGEWEFPQDGPVIDLALFAQTPLGELKDAAHLHERLQPVFVVAFERQAWILDPAPETRLEVALDLGSAEAGEESERICEVEIEVLEGSPDAALALALELLAIVPMRPSAITKAQRGYRLLSGQPREAARARPVALDDALTPEDAAKRVIASALEHLQGNEEGVLETYDAEYVHQARVALRRLRSALRLFRPVLPEAESRRWRSELGTVASVLGRARDWDVFVGETLPPLLKAHGDASLARSLRSKAQARRRREREAVRPLLSSPGHARTVLEIGHWIAAQHPALPGNVLLPEFASRIIRKGHERLLAAAGDLASLPASQRHALRVDAKRLRYGIEGFASLFRAKHVKRYLEPLAGLQETLGESNDAVTAAALVEALSPPVPFGDFARGWLAARAQGDPRRSIALVGALREAKRFWMRKPQSGAREA